jgi:Short C-terminal domain
MHAVDDRHLSLLPFAVPAMLCGALLLSAAAPARAGLWDALLGKGSNNGENTAANTRQRIWPVREFTTVALVSREAGASENEQPAQVQASALKQQLARVQTIVKNTRQPLFAGDELADVVGPLTQALASARPGDDIVLSSSSRREGGFLNAPTAVTARLFVQGGSLQLIVHDSRFDFYDTYRGTQAAPRFTYGSRDSPGTAILQGDDGATARRADWLSIPLSALQSAASPMAQSPEPPVAAPSGTPPRPQAATAAPRRPLDANSADDIERRLETLKRLREKGLISEDEYRQKRKEILDLL